MPRLRIAKDRKKKTKMMMMKVKKKKKSGADRNTRFRKMRKDGKEELHAVLDFTPSHTKPLSLEGKMVSGKRTRDCLSRRQSRETYENGAY